MSILFKDEDIVKGLAYADSVRTLNDRMGLKVALALAGTSPELFTQLLNVIKAQESAPVSTLDPAVVPRMQVVPK